MSYCPEHGKLMFCRNPEAYDDLVYVCPESHTIVYTDGAYIDSTHPGFPSPDPLPMTPSDTLALQESFMDYAEEWFAVVAAALKFAIQRGA